MAKPITLTLPPGVQIPDGKQPGDTFSSMVEFKLIDSTGRVQIEEIDGEPVDANAPENQAASPQDDVTQPSPLMQSLFSGGGQ